MKRMINITWLIFLLFSCATVIRIPVAETMPPDFLKVMKGGKNIAIYVDEDKLAGFEKGSNSKKTIYGSVENMLQKYGYYKIVDVKSRPERLKEIAFTQMTTANKTMVDELAIDGVLYMDIPQPPTHECIASVEKVRKSQCVAEDEKGRCKKSESYEVNLYVKTLYYTVFARSKLVNIGSGRTLQYANTKPGVLRNSSETGVECPSDIDGFNKALEVATTGIADNISPKMVPYKVPLYKSLEGVQEDTKSAVQAHLKGGVSWASTEPPNYELAKKDWEKALQTSRNSSLSAFWNLAVYYWYSGDIEQTDKYFQKAIEIGGPDWLDSTWETIYMFITRGNVRRDVVSTFNKEKERLKLEKKE